MLELTVLDAPAVLELLVDIAGLRAAEAVGVEGERFAESAPADGMLDCLRADEVGVVAVVVVVAVVFLSSESDTDGLTAWLAAVVDEDDLLAVMLLGLRVAEDDKEPAGRAGTVLSGRVADVEVELPAGF